MNWMQEVLDAKKRGVAYPGDQQQEGTSMSEKYKPDEAELIGCYAGAMAEQAGEDYDQAKADAERGIAKLKADALREAARKLFADETAEHGTAKAKRNAIYGLWLLDESDRIKGKS